MENSGEGPFSRTSLVFGDENMERLFKSRVVVFGVGGVGGHVVEALARSGVGAIDIVDNDTVSVSNLNRQILALHSTIGRSKVDVAAERILDINPACKVTKHNVFFTPESADGFDFSLYDYIVDCIDTVSGKIAIAVRASELGIPVISSMGAGNKLDPTRFRVSDVYDTSVCPLARVMRRELKRRGVEKLKCVFSTEPVVQPRKIQFSSSGKPIPGSNAFVPSVAGLIIASEVVKDLTGIR